MTAQLLHATFGVRADNETVAVPGLADSSTAALNAALEQVLSLCAPGSTISTRFAIEGLRHRLPELRVDNEDLVNIVADQAIARGLSVTFDSRED